MRDSIGHSWIFMIVIVFTLIFAGFLILTLSYSRAYKLKNEVTSILEKYEGLTDGSVTIINNYLVNSGYKASGVCQTGDYAVSNLSSSTIALVSDGSRYPYCISIRKDKDEPDRIIFRVTLFFDFNLPVFGQLNKYQIKGETYGIKYAIVPSTTP